MYAHLRKGMLNAFITRKHDRDTRSVHTTLVLAGGHHAAESNLMQIRLLVMKSEPFFGQIINNHASDRNPGRWEETRADPILINMYNMHESQGPDVPWMRGHTRRQNSCTGAGLEGGQNRIHCRIMVWRQHAACFGTAERPSALFQSHRASDHFSCPLSP